MTEKTLMDVAGPESGFVAWMRTKALDRFCPRVYIWLTCQLAMDDDQTMDTKALARYEARARIIKALAHPARLLIVDELTKNGERCVCELTEMIGSDMSTVSRHLAMLKGAGLIENEKRGQMVFYRLRVQCLLKFFDCIESVIVCNAKRHQELMA